LRKNSKTFFAFFTATMVLSGFGPYHGLWHKDAPSKRIVVTPTSGGMMHALGLGRIQPGTLHITVLSLVKFFVIFCSEHDVDMIVNNITMFA
jgi:hypothetical protein